MKRDAEATRGRILAAAVREFGEHGFSGARVDRIAEHAPANKRSIYVYFGDKERLFEATVTYAVDSVAAAVPIDPEDLPSYAVGLFDYFTEHPAVYRLLLWRELERPEFGPDEGVAYLQKAARIAARPEATPSAIPTVELMSFIAALAQAWFVTGTSRLVLPESELSAARRLHQHRTAIADAVRRLAAP